MLGLNQALAQSEQNMYRPGPNQVLVLITEDWIGRYCSRTLQSSVTIQKSSKGLLFGNHSQHLPCSSSLRWSDVRDKRRGAEALDSGTVRVRVTPLNGKSHARLQLPTYVR